MGQLGQLYVWIVLFVTLSYGAIGFYDDYLKSSTTGPQASQARCGCWPRSSSPASPSGGECESAARLLLVVRCRSQELVLPLAAFRAARHPLIAGAGNAVN